MKIIEESVIEFGAAQFLEKRRTDSRGYPPRGWFEAGCDFTQQQLQPFIVEFSEFCSSVERNSLTGLYWFNLKHLTTQQLLEEFIEFKNKK